MDKKDLPGYLKELRKSKSFTQKYVADKLHIARQTYSHYETGRIMPPVHALNALAILYNIPIDDLLDFIVPVPKDRPGQRTDLAFTINNSTNYIEFIHSYRTHLCELRRDEKICLYCYNYLNRARREDMIKIMQTFMEVPADK